MTGDSSGPLTPNDGREGPGSFPRAPRAGRVAAIAGVGVLVAVAAGVWFSRSLGTASAPATSETGADSAHVHGAPHDSSGAMVTATDSIVTAADLPGFETEGLSNEQRLWLFHRAHRERCGCGCGMNVAQCRVEDPNCPESPGRARELVEEAKRRRPTG